MPVKRALHCYREEKLNCAQSVLKAFMETHNVTESQVAEARALGGGRAENGTCGALYAALSLLNSDQDRQVLRDGFAATAGSDKCREIRSLKRLTCAQCVELAATELFRKSENAPTN